MVEEQEFEVELVRIIRTKVRVKATSANEIKKRIRDPDDNYALDLFSEGDNDTQDFKVGYVKKVVDGRVV